MRYLPSYHALHDAIKRAAKGSPELLEAMMQRAFDGDVGAARLLLERPVTHLKATDTGHRLNLPNGTLTEQGRAVMAAVSAGELSPSQGAALVGVLSDYQ